ncbi:MAG: [LysW]-lysine hydrolase [Candidatus Dormibacteraeota bacterium]|nr:[LysW]-lysine hydrolase [Candidatus Dormibacteraeota bacterium]
MITAREPNAHPTGAEDGFALLEAMVAIPSVSTEEEPIGQFLVERLSRIGFVTRRDNAGNVIAEWGKGPSEVLLLGHIDTVPGLIPVRREGSRLFGRGTVDAKGPFAAAATAVARQASSGACRFTLIGAVEEEGTSRGARHLLSRPAPEHLIILEPSGWDAITLGYKGSLRAHYRLTQPMSHGAGPVASAADRAIAFVRRIQDHAASLSKGKGSFDSLDARIIRFDSDHDGMTDVAALTVAFRTPPGFDVTTLQRDLEDWKEDAQLRIDYADAAVRAPKNTPLVRAFLKGIRQAGGTPRFKVKTGTSDMNILAPAWGCATLAYGPGDSKLDHTPEEAIDRADFDRGVDVLTSALAKLGR